MEYPWNKPSSYWATPIWRNLLFCQFHIAALGPAEVPCARRFSIFRTAGLRRPWLTRPPNWRPRSWSLWRSRQVDTDWMPDSEYEKTLLESVLCEKTSIQLQSIPLCFFPLSWRLFVSHSYHHIPQTHRHTHTHAHLYIYIQLFTYEYEYVYV